MAEPVREQVQNLNLSAQDSGIAGTNGVDEVDQFENIMADTDSPNVQQDPSIKHTTNGDTNMELNKGDNYEEKMYMDDSSDEDDEDFEYSKPENMEQRVPMSFGDENAYNEHRDNLTDQSASQFDGFQPFFPQGYQEEMTPKNQEPDPLLDNVASSEGQGHIKDLSDPPVSNQAMLIDFDKQNEMVGTQPANMQDINPFMDTQNSDMYSGNPFIDDLSRTDGVESQQVVPEAPAEDESGTGLSQTPDLILMGESCPSASHDSEVSSSLSETSGFDKAQNVIESIAQEGDTTTDNANVPLSEISSSVPEVAICDDLSRSQVQGDYDSDEQEYESYKQKGEFHDQECEMKEGDFQSQDQEFQSQDQEFQSQDQEFQSQDQGFQSPGHEILSHDQGFLPAGQEIQSQDQEFQQSGQEFQSQGDEFKPNDQEIPSEDQEFKSQDQDFQPHDQDLLSHDQEFEPQTQAPDVLTGAQEMSNLMEESEKVKDFEEEEREFISAGQISKQIESPEEDMTERCMGLIEPTQIAPEEEISQDPLEMVGSNSDLDHICQSDGFPQDAKPSEAIPSMDGSITMEGSQGFETDQIVNDVCKTPVDVSSSDQSSESQPQLDMRESGMSGSFILESGETLDDHPDEYPNDVSKSLTQGSSDEGEADDLNEQDSGLDTGIPNQMSRSAMEDSIILDDGETFDDQPQQRNEMTGSMIAETGTIDQQMERKQLPPQEVVPSAMEGSMSLEGNKKIDEIPVGMSGSLMGDSIPVQSSEPLQEFDDQNIENDYVPPQNGAPLHQEIPDIHYQSYDSQSGEIIETSGEVIDTQEDYIDDISSEESQDHLETSQRLAEEVSEHKDFTHRHPSELEVQREMDQGYFEQREDVDTPGEIDEDELYEQGDFDEQAYNRELHEQDMMQQSAVQAESVEEIQEPSSKDLADENQFKQVSEPSQDYPVNIASTNEQTVIQESVKQSHEIPPSEQKSEPVEAQIGSVEPEPQIQALSQVVTKELVEKESSETVTSEKEDVKSEKVSEISKVSEIKDSANKESPKKKEITKTAEKKKEEKSKAKTTESVTKKETTSKVTQKTISKPKSAPPRADAQKIPSPTKTSTPRPATTSARKSPPKSAEPTKSKSTTPSTGSKTERPTSTSASTPRRPVSAELSTKKNAIPLRKSLPSAAKDVSSEKKSPISPTKRETTSPTKRETTPRIPSKPRSAPQPRPKKDASSDSGVEEDKTTRKTTSTVTQKKKAGTTTTTQKTTTTTVKKTETKNGPITTDSRKSSPGTRTGVASKIGSMDNARHSPGGGNVKITTKKTDYSTVGSRIGSKGNLEHRPGGGEKKILTQKLEWKTGSKIGSLDNAKHSPGGGNVKIESKKLEFDKVQSRVGSKDNIKHQAGGGDKKIETVKVEFREKASSKVGSKDNLGHQPKGGDKKIETQKLTFREKAKPKTDSGASPLPPSDKSPPPENGVQEEATAAQ